MGVGQGCLSHFDFTFTIKIQNEKLLCLIPTYRLSFITITIIIVVERVCVTTDINFFIDYLSLFTCTPEIDVNRKAVTEGFGGQSVDFVDWKHISSGCSGLSLPCL